MSWPLRVDDTSWSRIPLAYTIRDHLEGAVPRAVAFSSRKRLSLTQETLLADWVLVQASLGLPPSHAQIRELTARVTFQRGKTQALGKR